MDVSALQPDKIFDKINEAARIIRNNQLLTIINAVIS